MPIAPFRRLEIPRLDHRISEIATIYRGVVPFVALNFVALLIVTYVPAISMILVGRGH